MISTLALFVRAMDRALLPATHRLTLEAVCIDVQRRMGMDQLEADEARAIMAEIDAKASALLAVLAIILAASAFVFSLSQTWLALILMIAQVAVISVSILYLLRCLIYEPAPHLRQIFEMGEAISENALQIEAIKQVSYFNRVIVQTVVTSVLFFVMSALIGINAMMTGTAL
ncbi:MAG: hypothetical protein AAGM84_13275 [Pseudomonadota bacterium]